uniref:Fibronectin type-III domain-containing protein n=1 Tax=Astyanax mexicanus TaxID=7994 RepID=A0A8B9GU74_ASTMX
MKTSVLLTWELPENFKSQVPFKILYNQQSVEVQGNLKRKLITGLKPDTNYSFVLMSRGNSAGGLQQQVSIRTAPDLLKTKPFVLNTDQASAGKLTINLPRVPITAPIRSVPTAGDRIKIILYSIVCKYVVEPRLLVNGLSPGGALPHNSLFCAQ